MDGLCCTILEWNARRHCPGVPESDQPDAIVEYHEHWPMGGPIWLLKTDGVEFNCFITHCPWCGTKLSTLDP